MSEQPSAQEVIQIPAPATPAKTGGARFLDELLWLAMGLVLPAGSFTFYKKAARRSAGWAILFFFLFTTVLAVISSLAFNRQVDTLKAEAEKELTRVIFPAVTVRNGVATATGPQPYVIYGSQGEIFAIDTTGKLQNIDTSKYTSGILLTASGVQVVNASQGRNQTIPWSELQALTRTDPLVIDKAAILGWVTTVMGWLKAGAMAGIWAWETLGRLLILLVIALIFWGIGALIKLGTGFGQVLAVGIYAYVPSVYLNFVLGQLGAKIPLKLSLAHFVVWGVMLLFSLDVFGKGALSRERSLRPWRVLLGLPALGLMPLQAVRGWETNVAWSIWAWALMEIALLVIGILGVRSAPTKPEQALSPK
jgi:hypothetical protein